MLSYFLDDFLFNSFHDDFEISRINLLLDDFEKMEREPRNTGDHYHFPNEHAIQGGNIERLRHYDDRHEID